MVTFEQWWYIAQDKSTADFSNWINTVEAKKSYSNPVWP